MIRKNSMFKRGVSLFLCCLMIFSLLSNVIVTVYGANPPVGSGTPSAQSTAVSFIDFYSGSGAEMTMDSLTTSDYYAMAVYMSNWFKPGETTLEDLLMSSGTESEFYKDFSGYMNKTSDPYLQPIIQGLGQDFYNAINTGDCTLVFKDGKPITGVDFLYAMMSTVDEYGTIDRVWLKGLDADTLDNEDDSKKMDWGLNSANSKLYFGTNSNITFDFSLPAYKAAVQVLFAYYPSLFIDVSGIVSLDRLYVDAVGNIWGLSELDKNAQNSNYNDKYPTKNTVSQASNVYLVLPACLNPSAFTNGVKSTDLGTTKFPLANRFALGAVFTEQGLKSEFSTNMIPIYNLFANSDRSKNILSIFAISSLSGYLFQTDNIEFADFGTWGVDNRRETLGNFIYNPDSIALKLDSNSSSGLSKFASNSGVVVSVNPYALNKIVGSKFKEGAGNADIDCLNDWALINVGENEVRFPFVTAEIKGLHTIAGSGKDISNKDMISLQKLFALYMFSPVFLNFNNVSMSLYQFDTNNITNADNALLDFAAHIGDGYKFENSFNGGTVDIGTTGLNAQELASAGLKGLSLFTDDMTFTVPDTGDGAYIYVSGQYDGVDSKSKLWNELEAKVSTSGLVGGFGSTERFEKFCKITGLNGVSKEYSGVDILDMLILHKDASNWKGPYTDLKNVLVGLIGTPNISDETGIGTLDIIPIEATQNTAKLYVLPQSFVNIGSRGSDYSLSATLGLEDSNLRRKVGSLSAEIIDFKDNFFEIGGNIESLTYSFQSPREMADYILALYGYRILYPSSYYGQTFGNSNTSVTFNKLFGKDVSIIASYDLVNATQYMQGVYLGYMVDTMGVKVSSVNQGQGYNIVMGSFNSAGLLPSYDISAKGGSASARSSNSGAGVTKSEDLSFEEKQKDLINRIYGLTNDNSNEYRNNLIKNIIEGFFLTVHRTITGTWGAKANTISTGSSNTYDSLAGFIYTPTLEELSFTATLMNNYIKIYVFCMMLLIFLLVLMVLLHMRTWQQGLLTLMFMSVGLLFPYVLISNTINIGNRVANNIYSDRFDFWAMSEHLQSEISLQGYDYMSETDQWLVSANVTSDDTYTGQPGVKVRWMSPKKVDMFNSLYSDSNLSQAFVTNTQIFKWLFSSFIYDSEFEDANVNASYVYRPYNTLAIEAKSYYAWGETLMESDRFKDKSTIYNLSDGKGHIDDSMTTYTAVANANDAMVTSKGGKSTLGLLAGISRIEQNIYQLNNLEMLNYSIDKVVDISQVSQFDKKVNDKDADLVGTWGLYSDTVINTVLKNYDLTDTVKPGMYSNLPSDSAQTDAFTKDEPDEIGAAIYLKNTESPFYYFYSVLKMRYHDSGSDEFKNALLNEDIFKVSYDVSDSLLTTGDRYLTGAYRDFLDLEGLFEYVIPYLKAGNDYVEDWQAINGSEIERYAFEYEVTDKGEVDSSKIGPSETNNGVTTYQSMSAEYNKAVEKKNAMNRIWNMYCPWVDAMYDMDGIYSQSVSVGGRKLVINDTLDPSSYIVEGRPMIFSEADMEVKGYSYKDLTDVERRLQAVTEKTYKDLMYLVNYYDMENEVLLVAAAMYATFNFNSEFSQDKFLADSVVMYPQGFELKNFNYDAYMRLALLNSTGETVFATDDLYVRILAKTSMFSGILLLLCDVLACIAIPMIKFVILVGLLFLGILVCIACVVNPPDKIFEAISKSVVLPTFLFMVLNIAFAYVMSFIVGEGLTTYVGSKSINFATNDPTITLLVMSLLSMAYLVCAWKIIKFLIDAYKKFGMSTALATVGIVGSAMVGFATAGKGNRLAGAFEGGHLGAKGVIDRRIRDKRYQKLYGEGGSGGGRNRAALAAGLSEGDGGGSKVSTDAINAKASKAKDDTAGQASTNPGGVATEADRQYTNDLNKNDTLLGKALSTGVYAKSRVQDAIAAGKHKKELKQEVKRAKQLDRQEKGTIKERAQATKERGARYLDKSLEQARQHSEYHNLKREVRASERSDELKFARWSNAKREEAVAAKKSRKVDTQY